MTVAARLDTPAGPRALFAEGRAFIHRAAVSGRAAFGGGIQGAQGGSRPDPYGARVLLERA